MALGNATTTATKRTLECINGDTSEPRQFKKRKRSNKIPNANHLRRRTQVGILQKLLSLGVSRPTWILHKTLETTDHNLCESRLLLTTRKVLPSPLLKMLTNTELGAVFDKSGLKVRAFDRLGREYCMVFKFLKSNRAYRLIGEWSQFLRENGDEVRVGDGIEIWGFRIVIEEGRSEIGMALLHYGNEEEGEEIDGKRECEKCVKRNGRKVTVTEEEWIAVVALLELKTSEVFP